MKIMIAILDENYLGDNYPEEYSNDYAHETYVFDTPQDLIEKWYELDEGVWHWVLVDGKVICSGALDPDDIEIFENYFGVSFEED